MSHTMNDPTLTIRFLGTGTSGGVPTLGCTCPVCTSADPRDNRLRSSALVTSGSQNLLIDCGPDFRQQWLGVRPFVAPDAILLTHEHFDHIAGLDDLRPNQAFGNVPIYAEQRVIDQLHHRLPYCFEKHYPGAPLFDVHAVEPFRPFTVGDVEIMPVRVMHGALPILGYVFCGRLGYVTDMKSMPAESYASLSHLQVLVMNALHVREHPSHQNIAEAIDNARRLAARDTYFIHMSHYAGLHAQIDAALPQGMHFAYDGLTVEVR